MTLTFPQIIDIAVSIWADPYVQKLDFSAADGHHVHYSDGRIEPISEQIHRQVLLLNEEAKSD